MNVFFGSRNNVYVEIRPEDHAEYLIEAYPETQTET